MAVLDQTPQANATESKPDLTWTTPSTQAAASAPLVAYTRINANGRIVIPAAMREQLGLRKEDSIVMEVEDGVLRIESYLARIRRIQAEFAHLAPPGGMLSSDELILERRREALLENETFERARELRRIRDGYPAVLPEVQVQKPQVEEANSEESNLA